MRPGIVGRVTRPQPDPNRENDRVKIDLPFEEAVRGLLKVDPDAEPVKQDDSAKQRGEQENHPDG